MKARHVKSSSVRFPENCSPMLLYTDIEVRVLACASTPFESLKGMIGAKAQKGLPQTPLVFLTVDIAAIGSSTGGCEKCSDIGVHLPC